MRIDNSFAVGLPVDDAWKVLLDIERIAPCIPGAELEEVTDDEYRGVVKVKLGAITAQYAGAVSFSEIDEAARRVVLRAQGTETKGQGKAAATVTASLRPAGDDRTQVSVETDLTISGRIAQFGRGVLADVSAKLLGEFARCLEHRVVATGQAAAAEATPPPESPVAPPMPVEIVADEIADVAVDDPERAAQLVHAVTRGPRQVESRPAEPLDLLAVAGGSVAERAVPAAIVGVLILQVLPKGRLKRLGLAVLGSALVAGLVAGKQQQQRQ